MSNVLVWLPHRYDAFIGATKAECSLPVEEDGDAQHMPTVSEDDADADRFDDLATQLRSASMSAAQSPLPAVFDDAFTETETDTDPEVMRRRSTEAVIDSYADSLDDPESAQPMSSMVNDAANFFEIEGVAAAGEGEYLASRNADGELPPLDEDATADARPEKNHGYVNDTTPCAPPVVPRSM